MSTWKHFKASVDGLYDNCQYEPVDVPNIESSLVEDIFKFYSLSYYKPLLSISEANIAIMQATADLLTKDLTRWLTYRAHIHSQMLSTEGKNDYFSNSDPINRSFNKEWKKIELSTIQKVIFSVRHYLSDSQCTDLYEYLRLDVNARLSNAETKSIIRPFNDAMWNTYYPPNTFSGMDSTELVDDGVPTEIFPVIDLNPVLAQNPALTGRFFTEEHIFYSLPEAQKAYLDKLSQTFYDRYVSNLTPTPAKPYQVSISTQKSYKSTIWDKIASAFSYRRKNG